MLPQEAIPKEDWERMQKGLSPLKKEKVIRPEPELPKVENRIEFAKILDPQKIKRIIAVSQCERIKNKDGITFLGYRIELELEDKTILRGWAFEGDAIAIKRLPWVHDGTDARILAVIR